MECHLDRRDSFITLLLFVALTGAAFHMPRMDLDLGWLVWFFYVGMVMFPFCALYTLRTLLRFGPIVTIDEEGIQDHRQKKVGVIRWEDIEQVVLMRVGPDAYGLGLTVIDPTQYLASQPPLRRVSKRLVDVTVTAHIVIDFNHATPSLDEVWNYLLIHHAGKITGPLPIDGDGTDPQS
jgi:hypothetical protein